MSREVIKLNLIPKGEMPVFHVSQFDTGRLITIELYNGDDAYNVPSGYTLELHCRKVDNNIVTLASTSIDDNVVKFTSTEQLTACNGKNLCEVAILDDDYRIGTLNFWLEVELDPLKGGITSTSEIHNLTDQIEEITTEIVGENYYDKTEVDNLLSAKADSDEVYTIGEVNSLLSGKANTSDVYTKSEVYNKTQVDTALALKADKSTTYTKTQVDNALALKADAVTTYTKTEVDTALGLKANAADVYTKTQVDDALALKANAADVYTKTQVDDALALKANAADIYTKTQVDNIILDIMPVDTASGAIASFDTEIAAPLVNVSCNIVATGGGGTPGSPVPIVGYTEANITANGNTYTISFSQTVYGGVLDVTRGKLTVTHYGVDLGTLSWLYNSGLQRFYARYDDGIPSGTAYGLTALCDCYPVDTVNNYNNLPDDTMSVGSNYISGTVCAIVVHDETYTNEATFKTAMSGHYVVGELATPFDIDLTPVQIRAIVGSNNVYSNTGNVTVKFKDSIQNYIDKKVST